jgi:lysophospholipid acyltransferase (LPLAT)-like uncharacterized protein
MEAARPRRRRKPVRRFLFRTVLPPLAAGLYRLLGATWRYVEVRKHLMDQALAGERPLVSAFFHARTFQLLHYNSRPDHGRWILMCSQSRDGELMSRVEERLGYRVVRGSSGGGGARALVSMIQAVKSDPGWSTCLAVDGSRGPRGIAQPGIITLAQKTVGLLLPVAAYACRCFVYRWSWDRSVLPWPFARVHVVFGQPLEVPARLDAQETEAIRTELERSLLALHAEADALSGFRDEAPLQARSAPV